MPVWRLRNGFATRIFSTIRSSPMSSLHSNSHPCAFAAATIMLSQGENMVASLEFEAEVEEG